MVILIFILLPGNQVVSMWLNITQKILFNNFPFMYMIHLYVWPSTSRITKVILYMTFSTKITLYMTFSTKITLYMTFSTKITLYMTFSSKSYQGNPLYDLQLQELPRSSSIWPSVPRITKVTNVILSWSSIWPSTSNVVNVIFSKNKSLAAS
jgi:hypothetical protein